ncbi:alpha-ribazole phosphatase [Aureivirga marina]|uniref:alpha-ribazole phosphatase n=1 Tax=Aureivirga marina TaxID=1182451 RepID=UPI0018CBC49A|nr:alpha-ribazole phosphatase [Aureivirga marina]
MEIKLIRHTTPDIGKGICYGQSDIPLKKTFNEEAKIVLEKLGSSSGFKVYSSPLKRCTYLAEKINPEFTISKSLLEMNFGDWEMKPWNSIPRESSEAWMQDFVHVKVPNGESYIELYTRVISFLNTIISKNENAIFVTHSGVIRSILAHITDLKLKDSFTFDIPFGSVISIFYENGKFSTNFNPKKND